MERSDILVLARLDPIEAMRVAAGLTVYGHTVRLVFMSRALNEAELSSEHAELLELADVVPETTVAEMSERFAVLGPEQLAGMIGRATHVVNV